MSPINLTLPFRAPSQLVSVLAIQPPYKRLFCFASTSPSSILRKAAISPPSSIPTLAAPANPQIPPHRIRSWQPAPSFKMAMNGGSFKHDNTEPPAFTGRVMPLFSLKGRTAIVSGAGAGIGLAVAQALAEAGANVAIWYNSNKKAIAEAENIEKTFGVKCKAYQVNVTDYASVEKAVNDIVDEFNGRLDVFIANSGIPWTQGAALDGEIDHYHKVISTNLDGTFYCARAAGRHWRRQKAEGTTTHGKKLENYSYGAFVATTSMSGHIVNIPQFQATYNASKAGVIHLCKSLAVEWVGFARANSVSPGYMATEITSFTPKATHDIWKDKIPMGREGQAHELKGIYLYLSSDASSYCTGTDVIVDGGYCLP